MRTKLGEVEPNASSRSEGRRQPPSKGLDERIEHRSRTSQWGFADGGATLP